jgi:hypothetical protein
MKQSETLVRWVVRREQLVRIVLPSLALVVTLACGSNTATCPCGELPEKETKPRAPEPSKSALVKGAPCEPSARATLAIDESAFGAEPKSKVFIEYVVGDEHRVLKGACRPRWEGENSDGHRGPQRRDPGSGQRDAALQRPSASGPGRELARRARGG